MNVDRDRDQITHLYQQAHESLHDLLARAPALHDHSDKARAHREAISAERRVIQLLAGFVRAA